MSTTTEAQRQRYARRAWADRELGAQMTPETLHAPLPAHGPSLPGALYGELREMWVPHGLAMRADRCKPYDLREA
jgi:hypothetical protein